MSKMYKDAVIEANRLRELAEQNAKNKIIEAVAPRIRRLIEQEEIANSLLLFRSWPIDMAYFPYGGGDQEPEFEVHFTVMENGVSPSMDLDYGNFALRAEIEELEYHDVPDC